MKNVLIEAEINQKHVRFMQIFSILYFIMIVFFPIGIVFLIIASGIKNQKLIVTKKNVQGRYGTFIKGTIDLPLDSINSVECYEKTGNILISTSSKTIRFQSLTNAKEVANVINELLRNRYTNSTPVVNELSAADELTKYKKLLDNGVITQEEFDAKKKQLLGL